MTTRANWTKHIPLAILALVFLLTAGVLPQSDIATEDQDFKFIVERSNNVISLTGEKGSAWLELSFTLMNQQPQAVDEWGMTELDKGENHVNPNLANFLITISTDGNRIIMAGLEGTTWSELTFGLDEGKRQAVDQDGMTSLD